MEAHGVEAVTEVPATFAELKPPGYWTERFVGCACI
jgi:hypothetical protein